MTPTLRVLLFILLFSLSSSLALAQDDAPAPGDPPNTKTSPLDGIMAKARDAYNDENYKDAISLYVQAAQVDPGARKLRGVPYRNIARCHYWLGNFSSSSFWYKTYLKHWPKADDFDAVSAELNNANNKRTDPDSAVSVDIIYDRNLRELAAAIRLRIKNGADAWTAQGGGSAALYDLAIKRGYALPEIAGWAQAIRRQLLSELSARWRHADNSPLPLIGVDSEPIRTSLGRLQALERLSPSSDERKSLAAYSTLLRAWSLFIGEDYADAATAFSSDKLPDLSYIPYAQALAQFKAGDTSAADATLRSAIPRIPKQHVHYYLILHAETLRAMDKHEEAAALYFQLLK